MASERMPHVLAQAALGEFATLKREAEQLGPAAFASKYGGHPRPWGKAGFYTAVRHEGTDYLWRTEDGKFDGWDGIDLPPLPKEALDA